MSHKMAARRLFLKNGVSRTSRWPFPAILCFITMDNDIIDNLTMNQSAIIRYVKVIRAFAPIFLAFYPYFSAFSVITLVLEIITFWFMADL